MPKLHACIISADAKRDKDVLVSVAQGFSAGIELLEDGVLFDVSGLEKLMGNADQITQRIGRALRKYKIEANVAVAGSADTAILLARVSSPQVSKVSSGSTKRHDDPSDSADKFSQLPLHDLQIDDDTLKIFNELGIKKIEDLRRLPADDLVNRYGRKFRDILDIAEQKGGRILTPNVKESNLTWAYDLDSAVEDFEQLIFIVNHGLDKLFTQISHSALSTEQLDIYLGLRKKEGKLYEIKTSFPTLEKTFWLKLVNLRIALDPPEADILSVRIVSHFAHPRPDQKGLFAVSRPEPESLLLTVNKIRKLIGEDNVGVPALVDQRIPEPFRIDCEKLPLGKEKLEVKTEKLTAAFCYFRPPIPVSVTVQNRRLFSVTTPYFSGTVKEYSGVWKKNSHWWNHPWSDHEWDIEVEDEGVYRLRNNSDDWFLTGVYD